MQAGMNNFFWRIIFFLISVSLFGCKSTNLKRHESLNIRFLSEYILSPNITIGNTVVGGLSGIDFYNGIYYLVCDDSNNPRIYEATIDIDNDKISNIHIDKVVQIKNASGFLDLESIRFDKNLNQILLTSEGNILKLKDPSFFSIDTTGEIKNNFSIPEIFKANSKQKPRHNGTLEGSCLAFKKKGSWIAMELPLEADGPEPRLKPTRSPVRITFINTKSNMPGEQFAYLLDPVAKKPKSSFLVNGLTDLLQYDANSFLVLERSYSSGLGNQGNTIKLFKADISKATNIAETDHLKDVEFIPAQKELLLDFEDLRDKLTDNSIDNIEGITFGPKLPNGHQTLLLVSDNNFNRQEKQLNQFILLELIE